MRTGLSVAFGILIITLLVCMVIAKKSRTDNYTSCLYGYCKKIQEAYR